MPPFSMASIVRISMQCNQKIALENVIVCWYTWIVWTNSTESTHESGVPSSLCEWANPGMNEWINKWHEETPVTMIQQQHHSRYRGCAVPCCAVLCSIHTIPHYISFSELELLGIAVCFCSCQGFQSLWGISKCAGDVRPLYLWVNCFGFALKFGGLNAVGVKHPFSISVYLLKF